MRSKEEQVLELFFSAPTREWHFEEILQETKMARSKVNRWLKKFLKERMIKRIKGKGKMPFYLSNYESPEYKNKKKMFALARLYESGLLSHLSSLPKARTVILFGSFSRSDWYEKSDIDIFIYGNPEGLSLSSYETRLHRDIQLFICKTKEELTKYSEDLLRNIIKGNLIKGDLDFITVKINA
ncbi:MAG: nucleotidyltransferase domain-containing protein [Nanoarchaeota archaeon]